MFNSWWLLIFRYFGSEYRYKNFQFIILIDLNVYTIDCFLLYISITILYMTNYIFLTLYTTNLKYILQMLYIINYFIFFPNSYTKIIVVGGH